MPIVGLLLERGEFLAADTIITAQVLRVYLIGLPFAAVDQMLIFASYARKDTWRPALVGVISIVFYTIVAWLLLEPLGLLSLMVADAVKHMLHTALMIWVLTRHLGDWRGFAFGSTVVKSTVAAVITGFSAYGIARLMQSFVSAETFLGRLVSVSTAGVIGLVIFIFLAHWLRMPEALSLIKIFKTRVFPSKSVKK